MSIQTLNREAQHFQTPEIKSVPPFGGFFISPSWARTEQSDITTKGSNFIPV
jgi:hypothetical protein